MFNTKRQLVLAIDLGDTKIASGLVSDGGELIVAAHCLALADEGLEAVIKRLLSLARRVLDTVTF